jgi:hypothetical protein
MASPLKDMAIQSQIAEVHTLMTFHPVPCYFPYYVDSLIDVPCS